MEQITYLMSTIDFHNLAKSLAISVPSIPFFRNSNLLPCPSKNPRGLIFFQNHLYNGCIVYCYKIEIQYFFQTFKWTSFQWWPWQFQLKNFSLLKLMNNLGIFVLLENATTIENYFYDKQASQPPTILVPLESLLSMVAFSWMTIFIKLGSCQIWKQATQVRLMKGSLQINSLLKFLCLKQPSILYSKLLNFNSTLVWGFVAHANPRRGSCNNESQRFCL